MLVYNSFQLEIIFRFQVNLVFVYTAYKIQII